MNLKKAIGEQADLEAREKNKILADSAADSRGSFSRL